MHDTFKAVESLLKGKQTMFDYGNKPGKIWARLLVKNRNRITSLKTARNCDSNDCPTLEVFQNYTAEKVLMQRL